MQLDQPSSVSSTGHFVTHVLTPKPNTVPGIVSPLSLSSPARLLRSVMLSDMNPDPLSDFNIRLPVIIPSLPTDPPLSLLPLPPSYCDDTEFILSLRVRCFDGPMAVPSLAALESNMTGDRLGEVLGDPLGEELPLALVVPPDESRFLTLDALPDRAFR